MRSWEQAISRFLHTFGLDTIKRKILVFALVATLIPSLIMGWLSYAHNKRSLTEKISEELRNVTSHTSREIDLWLKERFYDVRVFSNSYEVSENLEKIVGAPAARIGEGRVLRRLMDYLNSVREKFIDYEELLVIDPKGRVVATSAGQAGGVSLPRDWVQGARKDKVILGDPHWDTALDAKVMMIAVPIKRANGPFLGVLAAKVNFRKIDGILKSFSLGRTGEVYLIGENGVVLVSSQEIPSPPIKTQLGTEAVKNLLHEESNSRQYTDYKGREVVGTLKRLPQLNWAVVAQIESQEAYAQVVRLQYVTFLVVSGLLLGGGLIAYLLGLTIVRPLDRLTSGAREVAAGDLDVDLPVVSRGEVGYMTEVFNHMVAQLRQGREELAEINKALSEKNRELEALSVTDGLTGLYNRSHMMETLANEAARARRHKHPFSVLMIDIDHFKEYNDSFGHLAGDAVLIKMASIFTKSIRSVEYAARYGGEEFLIMLPESEANGAMEAAERIRSRVAAETFGGNHDQVRITVSIGVAGFPEHGGTPESIIESADAALYEAKRAGRNRVVCASNRQGEKSKTDG